MLGCCVIFETHCTTVYKPPNTESQNTSGPSLAQMRVRFASHGAQFPPSRVLGGRSALGKWSKCLSFACLSGAPCAAHLHLSSGCRHSGPEPKVEDGESHSLLLLLRGTVPPEKQAVQPGGDYPQAAHGAQVCLSIFTQDISPGVAGEEWGGLLLAGHQRRLGDCRLLGTTRSQTLFCQLNVSY